MTDRKRLRDTERPAVQRADIPFLREAATYCRARASMAWSDAERERWTRRAAWNDSLAETAEGDA